MKQDRFRRIFQVGVVGAGAHLDSRLESGFVFELFLMGSFPTGVEVADRIVGDSPERDAVGAVEEGGPLFDARAVRDGLDVAGMFGSDHTSAAALPRFATTTPPGKE